MTKKTLHSESTPLEDQSRTAQAAFEDDSQPGKAERPEAFPIVGLGASAGGLAAFEAFFAALPATGHTGMAFVLVQHLAPDHKSMLSELIRRFTRMGVYEVEDGMRVEPNCVYIIPPNRDMAFLNGALHLLEPVEVHGFRSPIDFFFRSLAQDQHERAICVVLSGTGSDGTQGVRAIKGEGGLAIAQNPESTEYDGMPRSAIATGLVDYVLTPSEMPAKLAAYSLRVFTRIGAQPAASSTKVEEARDKIFVLLRAQTGHDFSLYKLGTVSRRIERRMAVHQIEDYDEYVRFLQATPTEVEALFRDLLIGVTTFFRDPKAYATLESKVIPKLLSEKAPGTPVRVWVPACSTGEEAYSIAMLIKEQIEQLKLNLKVQVFASDLDPRAIEQARAGYYSTGIAADVTAERLARFFVRDADAGTYQVAKSLRDMLLFSVHDVIRDPPFSKLDLISCRNLLIYMKSSLQKRVIPLFHYALNPDGILFLGDSESIGDNGDLFAPLDRTVKVYKRMEGFHGNRHFILGGFMPALASQGRTRSLVKISGETRDRLRELTEQGLLRHLDPVAVLVDAHGEILFLHGRTGRFLEPAPGEAEMNIFRMARQGLKSDLTAALHKSVAQKTEVNVKGIRVEINDNTATVDLSIRPVLVGRDKASEPSLYLIVFEERGPGLESSVSKARTEARGPEEVDAQIAALQAELLSKEELLNSSTEELETSNEELKSTTEEMQSVNEELQSTNEELETSKEELQSVNEELSTINAELQQKVLDLSHANNDLKNLLAGTEIGTIFVDHQLCIQRFTPAASQVINLIATDMGRPLGHIASNLESYDGLVADTKAVLASLVPKEIEVQKKTGEWFQLRIRPYRTLENVIEGAVITFVDISEIRRAKEAEHRLAIVLRDSSDAVMVHDLLGRILAWNSGATKLFGWTEHEALRMNIRDLTPEDQASEAMASLERLSRAELIEPYLTERVAKGGRILKVSLTASALVRKSGEVYAVVTTERAVS